MSSHSDHPPQPQLSSLGWACTGPGRTVPPPHCVASVSVHVHVCESASSLNSACKSTCYSICTCILVVAGTLNCRDNSHSPVNISTSRLQREEGGWRVGSDVSTCTCGSKELMFQLKEVKTVYCNCIIIVWLT